jgi:hypothetical protein
MVCPSMNNIVSCIQYMLVQVQEAGPFDIRDKLGMRLVTEDSIHTDCETYESMEGYKLLMTSMVQDRSRKQCLAFLLLLVAHFLTAFVVVSSPQLKHMLACVHFSNERPGMLCCNKQPVYNENKLEVCVLNLQWTHKNCMS